MPLLPPRFLVRVAHPCRYVKDIPHEEGDQLLDLPASCVLESFAGLEEPRGFAPVSVAWNELGLAFSVEVKGKHQDLQGDVARPRHSDGVTVWIDTRDARTSHRASRYCHQFHLLPTGGGPQKDEPALVQSKIHRALQDAPLCRPNDVPFQCTRIMGGYRLEAFFPATALTGYDPEQSRRLGFYYAVRDVELGEQVLSVGSDFPYWEDPSLWSVLELVRAEK